jgi:hypothetical protein
MATCQPLTAATLPQWKARLSRVTDASQPQFGAMSAAAMLRHLRRTLEPATGEFQPPEDMSNFLTRTALFRELFLRMPWPKGKVKAPGWLTPPADGDVETERALLFATLDRFAAMHARDPQAKTQNPLLGPVSLEYVSRLQGRHLEHHCGQFGV